MKPRVVIFVEGGLVQSVISDTYCEILILDSDGESSGNTRRIRDWDFSKKSPSDKVIEVFNTGTQDPDAVDPEAVNHFFSQMSEAEAFESGYQVGDRVVFEDGKAGEIIMVDPMKDSNFIVRIDGIEYSIHPSHFLERGGLVNDS